MKTPVRPIASTTSTATSTMGSVIEARYTLNRRLEVDVRIRTRGRMPRGGDH
jgi:hypothetical protein